MNNHKADNKGSEVAMYLVNDVNSSKLNLWNESFTLAIGLSIVNRAGMESFCHLIYKVMVTVIKGESDYINYLFAFKDFPNSSLNRVMLLTLK